MQQNGTAGRATIGLACAGGVVEGAIYEVGALCAIDDAVQGVDLHDLDMYVGVSSGALVGALLANGVSARTLSRAIVSEAYDPRLNLEPEVLFKPAFGEYLGRIRQLPRRLLSTLTYYASNPGDLSLLGLLSTFGTALPSGFFDNTPLEVFLRDALDASDRTNDFRTLGPLLRVVTMHLDTADLTVFGEPGLDDVPISKAIQASTALPGLYCPVEINGRQYIDGVARRTMHASVALNAGADLLFCINPIVPVRLQMEEHAKRLLTEHPTYSLADHGLPSVLSQTFRALVDSRKQTGFKKYEHTHPDADLLLIEPDPEDADLFFSNIFSFRNRHDVAERAYRATLRYFRRNATDIAPTLHRHGLSLRADVLYGGTRSLYDAEDEARLRKRITGRESPSTADVLDETNDVLNRLDDVLTQLQRH